MLRRWVPLLMLLVAACAVAPEVRTDYDRNVDFSRYRSFAFESRPDLEGGYSSLAAQRLRAAVTRELQARGYELREAEPDLLVAVSAGLRDRLRVVPRPGPWGPGPWGLRRDYWGWPGWGWPGYWDSVEPFTEGIVNIDLIDRQERRMVWQGMAVAPSASRLGNASQAETDAAVAAIFAEFPFRAGLPATRLR
jgi:hypothetical protein